jgi:hypothetical protein
MPAVLPTRLPLPGDAALEKTRHADGAAREQRHNSLAAKMAAHRQGSGPAPTAAEFAQCKEDAAFEQAMDRLLADAPLPR